MTDPIPASLLARLESKVQSVQFRMVGREVRQFRAYCCNIDSDSIMNVAKEPVIFLRVTPQVICVGESISWSISDSYAPGSTLTAWSVDFGDETTPASGADFVNDTTTGSHAYSTAGSYTITATVEEGGPDSLDQTVETQVEVVECGSLVGLPGIYSYVSDAGAGVFFIDWGADTPDWVERTTGLSGDALYVNSLAIDPSTKLLADEAHILWAATRGGIYRSGNGGRSWGKVQLGVPSNLEFGDFPAAAEDELNYRKVILHPSDANRIYVVATKEDG